MTCSSLNIYLLVQTVLYFAISVLGFVVALPLIITYVNFENKCMLYATFTDQKIYFLYHPSRHANCNYVITTGVVAGIIYGLTMTVLYIRALMRKEPNTSSQARLLMSVAFKAMLCVAVFISSCMISVGFKTMCDGLEAILKNTLSCSAAQALNWNALSGSSVNAKSYYSCFRVAEIASWTCFLAHVAQVILTALRFCHMRRKSGETTASRQPSDMHQFASDEPTA